MIRSTTAAALLLGGLYAPLLLAADGIPVVDRTDQPQSAVSASSAAPVDSTSRNAAVSNPVAPASTSLSIAPDPAVSATAELLMMLDQLQEEVGFLRGQLEEQQHLLQRIQVDQRDRYRDLDRRLSILSQKSVSAAPATTLPVLPTPLTGSSAALAVPATVIVASKATDSAPTMSDAQAYKQAFSLVRERDFDAALLAFERFLHDYPSSALTANVLYWTGEVHRAKPTPDQEKASFAYQQVVERYPDHPKVADAYYKLGLSYQGMGQVEKAKASMAKVIELFPNQAPASLARDFLKP
ncbi:MAG: tol-pal system protein YbgF [Halopseudomonas sp.]